MNNKFKRIISSVLAFIMLFSSFVVMNVGSVFADSGNGIWSFRSGDTNQVEAKKYFFNGNSGEIEGLLVDATASGAKFDYKNRSDWAQCNTGTIIKIPVSGPSEITITTYSGTVAFTLEGKSYTTSDNTSTVTYKGEAGYAEFVMGANDYIGSITVVAVEIEDEVESDDDYGFYDFGGAEGSYLTSDDYTNVYKLDANNKIPAANSGEKVHNLALISTDGNAVIKTGQSVKIDGTTYTGYFHTNGAQNEGQIKRTIEIDVKHAGDIISVVSSSSDLKTTYSLEIYNLDNKTEKYLNKAMPGEGSVVHFAAPSAGTYVINGFGTKANYYRVTVTKPIALTITPVISADGKPLANATVKLNKTEYTTGDDGKISVDTQTGTAFDVTTTIDGNEYIGDFVIAPDGTYPETVTVRIPRTTVEGTVTGLEEADKSLAKLVLKADNETLYVDVTDGNYSVSLDNDYKYTVSSVFGGYTPYKSTTSQVTVSAPDITVESTKEEPELKSYEYKLGTDVFPQNKDVQYTVATTQDGIVTFERTGGTLYWNDGTHGVAVGNNTTITIPVAGACQVVFGDCEYTVANSSITATAKNSDYTETKTTAQSCSGTMEFTYTGDADTLVFTVTSNGTCYIPTINIIPTLTIGKDVYVGYTDTTPNFSSVSAAVETIADVNPPASEDDRITIYIADGTYTERVVVDIPYITFKGESTNGTIITYNDNESNNDTYFHGATVAVVATGFEAGNISFRNTAEEDKVANGKNATAFSIGYGDNLECTAKLTDVNLLAARDTVYTGKSTAKCEVELNNCLITGFQDVICGTGIVTLNDCTMDANEASGTTRFFAPASSNDKTIYTANNLTIKNSKGDGNLFFARFWSQGKNSDIENYQVIINGYTVESGKLNADLFDVGLDSSNKNTKFFTYRKDQNDNYKTTYAGINEIALNSVDTKNSGVDKDGDYKLIGETTTTLNNDADAIGFALYDADGKLLANVASDTVYNVGDDTTKQYTINFIKSKTGAESVNVKGYVSINGFDLVNDESDATITLK